MQEVFPLLGQSEKLAHLKGSIAHSGTFHKHANIMRLLRLSTLVSIE